MRSAFQFQLMLIVLMNVTFVHVTGAVGLNWLIPMYLLTLMSPFALPLQDRILYRIAWNIGVVVIFTILLVDAATTGITFLLEDGLILAAFCQVHLLNVIKRHAGADLLFFNSFLIALVTSLFCRDLVFSAVFTVYAVVLLIAMHMSTIVGSPIRPPQALSKRLTRQAVQRAASVLVITSLVFMLCPRDFKRQGFVGEDLLQAVDSGAVGFSEEIRLGQSAIAPIQQRVVMRVRVLDGERAAVPELWRGATLNYFDESGWQGIAVPQDTSLAGSDGEWTDVEQVVWTRPHDSPTIGRVRVSCSTPVPSRLFMPLGTHRVRLDRPSHVEPLIDGTLRYNSAPPLNYEFEFENGSLGRNASKRLDEFKHLEFGTVPHEIRYRVVEALDGLGRQPSQRDIVEACTQYLTSTYSYLLPGERGAARNLNEFITGEGGGHCEYFATALAVMLRLRRIPCRVVTGYRVHEWDDQTREFIVRDSHAHAWVEVWDVEHGWLSADATPAAEIEIPSESSWSLFRERIDAWWTELVRFDSESHGAVIEWVVGLPKRLVAAARTPLGASSIVLAILAVIAWRWGRRRGRRCVAVYDYERALRRAGVERRNTETPRELLERAASTGVDPAAVAQLREATEQHERARYQLT